jgi:hypothetical protein
VARGSAPPRQILFLALYDAQDLWETIGPNWDRYQHRDVAHLPAPVALEDYAIEKQVAELTDDSSDSKWFGWRYPPAVYPASIP